MNKNIIPMLVAISIVSIILISGCTTPAADNTTTNQTMSIGAIVALSGPSAVWGESLRNGMQLALEDHPNMRAAFQDSKGTAADGISAYHDLETQNLDVFVSSLSIVSVPLAAITKGAKMPMVVTQSAANNITNEYTYRYYSNADNFALPAFTTEGSPIENLTKIAVLYRNDEYAKSVANKIQQLCAEQGKQIVFMESYAPNEVDFSTPISKIKQSTAQAFLFIPTPPSESLGILRKAAELNLSMPIVEVSNVQSDPATRAQAPNITFYTEQFAFSKPGNSETFKQRYRDKYGKEPNFVAAFGFDIVNLLSTCNRANIKACLDAKSTVTGITGTATNITNHDIVMPMSLVRVN